MSFNPLDPGAGPPSCFYLAPSSAQQPATTTSSSGTAASSTAPALPGIAGDVGIRDGRIAADRLPARAEANKTIDAAGMVVAPGFIDMLGQSDLSILVNPHAPSKIFQGITTEFTGEGGSAAPLNDTDHRGGPAGLRSPQDHAGLADPGGVLRPTGASRESGSTSGTMWVRPRCAGWCWATTIGRRRPTS